MRIGDACPEFSLPGVDGRTWGLADFAGAPALVVVETCNHCPYVVAYQDRLLTLARAYGRRGIAFVGICSNDAEKYPQDSFENMQVRAAEVGIGFPYLRDEDQCVARAFGAERTPEFFVFDGERRLVYHGRLDDNLEDGSKAQHHYLREALDAILAGQRVPQAETQAIGCTVKWR
jgi:peroxiredoxin